MQDNLNILRKRVEAVDKRIIGLLSSRFKLSRQIGRLKKQSRMRVEDRQREKLLGLMHENQAKKAGLNATFVRQFFRLVLKHSKKIQG